MSDTAGDWYDEHREHVDRLRASTTDKYAPTGSDRIRPDRWKPAHWNWYFDEEAI